MIYGPRSGRSPDNAGVRMSTGWTVVETDRLAADALRQACQYICRGFIGSPSNELSKVRRTRNHSLLSDR